MSMETAGRFAGKVAIVTGSSADPSIGRSTAVRLAREGASVVVNGRSAERLAATEKALRDEGLPVAAVQGSLDDDNVMAALVDAALDNFGAIDLVVNTVGGAPFPGPLWEMDRERLMGTISLNTWPTVALVKEAMARGLAEGGGGAVVNISSGSPNKTTASMAAYAAAKAALNTLTRTMAADAGRRGVRVNAVSPGLTATSATRSFWESDGGVAAGSHLVLGRLTTADDIAAAACFLLSDDSRQITGVVIDVDGGNHLQSGGWSPFAASSS
jgi:A-factor type gamma-butyrolactone 1'-reductase (1S-forming)